LFPDRSELAENSPWPHGEAPGFLRRYAPHSDLLGEAASHRVLLRSTSPASTPSNAAARRRLWTLLAAVACSCIGCGGQSAETSDGSTSSPGSSMEAATDDACLPISMVGMMSEPQNSPCDTQGDCRAPLACASDYRCRNLCMTDGDCNLLGITGKVCAKDANGVGYCADPSEVREGVIAACPPPGAPDAAVTEPPLGWDAQ